MLQPKVWNLVCQFQSFTAFADKSFTFVMKTPPASILLKKAAGLQKGSSNPPTNKVGKLTRAQLEEIAKTKEPDLTAADLDAAVRTICRFCSLNGLGRGGCCILKYLNA